MRKSVAVALAAVLLAGTAGAGAYATVAAPPKTVAGCANTKNGGYFRLLEAKNLPKSAFGKCRPGEVKVPLSTTVATGAKGAAGRGFDKPFRLTISGGAPLTCTWQAATETVACAIPPTPTPTPTPAN